MENERNILDKNMSKKKKVKTKEKKATQSKGITDTDAAACFLASEAVLGDWNRPEEDEAWKDL